MNRMISQLEGKIVAKDLKKVTLDVHGVGYKIFISGDTFERIKKNRISKSNLPLS